MKILYFAWVRERIGRAEEACVPPQQISDVGKLLGWLCQQSPNHEEVLGGQTLIRVAVNQTMADLATPISAGDEIAIFPPMTGG